MKIRHITGLLLAVLTLGLASCTMESVVEGESPEGQEVVIRLAAATRATAAGDAADSYINSLRVLGYRVSDQKLAFNETVGLGSSNVTGYNGKIKVKTGRFLIVLVANEHSDAALKAKLDGITPTANNTLAYLQDEVYFAHTAFAVNKDIPMTAFKNNVTIQGDDQMLDDGVPVTAPWAVTLQRLGVRLDLTMTLYTAAFDSWFGTAGNKRIYFNNVPKKVYLFPDTDNSAEVFADNSVFVTYAGSDPTAVDGKKTVILPRAIILPESCFAPVSTKAKGLSMSLIENSNIRSGVIASGNAAHGYTLPRNTYLDVTGTVAGASDTEFTFDINPIHDWNGTDIPHEI